MVYYCFSISANRVKRLSGNIFFEDLRKVANLFRITDYDVIIPVNRLIDGNGLRLIKDNLIIGRGGEICLNINYLTI